MKQLPLTRREAPSSAAARSFGVARGTSLKRLLARSSACLCALLIGCAPRADLTSKRAAERPLPRPISRVHGSGEPSEALRFRVSRHQLLGNRPIEISVVEGTAVLEGGVHSELERSLAQRIAADTRGVRAVNNRLAVGAVPHSETAAIAPQSDDALRDSLMSIFGSSKRLHAEDISVRVEDGIATLRGAVSSPDTRSFAEEVAVNVTALIAVDNRLRVRN